MELLTENTTTNCQKCNKNISYAYAEIVFMQKGYYYKYICCDCLIKNNKNKYKHGVGCYVPCTKCKTPNIKWFYVENNQNCNFSKDCGHHNLNYDNFC